MMKSRSFHVLVQLAARGTSVANQIAARPARSYERGAGILGFALTVAMAVGIPASAFHAFADSSSDRPSARLDDSANTGRSVYEPSPAPAALAAPHRIFSFRADSANGSGPYASGSRTSPWVDLVNAHDGAVWNLQANTASGWAGNGTLASPYRLELNGREERVAIPAGSIPELQQVGPITAEFWFKTGFDGPSSRYDYILEWVQAPTANLDPLYEGRGMSVVVSDGRLKVYANPWVDAGPVAPNRWYHVAVVKDSLDLRVYVNGDRTFTGTHAHQGVQQSELVLGCSTFRVFESVGRYGDHGNIAIGRLALWSGALNDTQVRDAFRADKPLYLPPAGLPAIEKVLELRADRADGRRPYSPQASGIEWADLASGVIEAALVNFDATPASGWQGDGSLASPHRLQFDGIDDVAVVPASSLPQLIEVSAVSTAIWFKTPNVLPTTTEAYLLEWIEGFNIGNGMALALTDGKLNIWGRDTQSYPFDRKWLPVAELEPNRWYHVVATKQPGQVRVYLDGALLLAAAGTELGDAVTEVTIGASTWRGEGQYADHFGGAIGQLCVWRGALDATQVMNEYKAGYADFNPIAIPRHAVRNESVANEASLALAGVQPNPASSHLRVAFTLPTAGSAEIELIDVSGRRIRSRTIGTLGAGQHIVDLAEESGMPAAGIYFVRLTHGDQALIKKAIVMSH